MPEASAVYRLGLDVGGTNLRLGVFSDLALVEETRFQANYSAICKQYPPAQAWQTILQVTADAIRPLLNKYPAIQSIGIGFPGFINPQTGILAQSPNLPGLRDVNLGHDLTDLLGIKVRVENDANAAAYGEYGQLGQPAGGLLYIGLGTGVGAGLVVNGKVWAGHHGYALEAGHIIVVPEGRLCGCGNQGCVEQYASATGISQAYADLTGQTLTAQAIAVAADQGDSHAQAVYADAGSKLAQMLASVLKVVDVENVLIGGGVVAAWSLMSAAFQQRLEHDLIPVLRGKIQVHTTHSGDVAGMLGAALLAV
ncbi:ROK family protein [Methylophilus sp. UBA6697]|jgi:glucokinase|uniref:ROK family protein n=1 Tax=Methylophilus sp. UBA6697 TaxID=1946902 RepID=UPI000EC1FDF8|nr:ROK family protein [Methylophilus sp. UBA6697]HCU84573.1 glucokinase [Methylophilus sp.]